MPQAEHFQGRSIVSEELDGQRLDQALAHLFPDYSRTRLQGWVKAKQVQVNGKFLRSKDSVAAGECIVVDATWTAVQAWHPEPLALDVIYEDDAVLIVNKAAGRVVHPAIGNPDGTLVNALLHYAPELAYLPRAGLVHRIDKDTTGLLAVAKTATAHASLVRQLEAREIKREYIAVVRGEVIAGGTVDAPLGRDPYHRTKIAVVPGGKPAVTHYRVREKFKGFTSLNLQLETGRTHQIRVHMASIQLPLVGDQTYGGRFGVPKGCSEACITVLREFKRQALHAAALTLTHPVTQASMRFEAPLPSDMAALLSMLRAA